MPPRSSRAFRALDQSPEPDTVTGHGRRKSGSFGSPAGRASRDGTDGTRGDGRPPVGTFNHTLHQSMKEKEDYSRPLAHSARPSTGLSARFPTYDDPNQTLSKLNSPRTHRSMENVTDQPSEVATVRSHLKSIGDKNEMPENRPPERELTIADLGDMIDFVQTSLKHSPDDEQAEPSSEQTRSLATPRTSMIRRWRSGRAARGSINTSTEAEIHHPLLQHAGVADDRWHPAENQNKPRGLSLAPAQLDVIRNTSPVKQRAAMFERMQKAKDHTPARETPPDHHVHVKETWRAIPQHEPTPEVEQGLHGLKFGRTVYERPGSSLSSPREPTRVGHRQDSESSGQDTASFNTARQSNETGHAEDKGAEHHVTIDAPSRKTSASWLPPWRLFSKGSSASPQITGNNANATAEKDEHYPQTRPSLVQTRVQNLLSAERKREDDPQQFMPDHLKRRPTPYPGKVTESEVKEKMPSPESLVPSHLAPLQVPIQEEAEALQPLKMQAEEMAGPYTPLPQSMTEKEVFDSPNHVTLAKEPSQPASIRSASPEKGSPSKTAPSTPRRGRAMRASMSPRGSGYAMEQAFVISPGRSRSRSRASGSRMLVEVEVRDSPGREAREMGQKVVFVRADVNDIDEEEEA